MNIRFLFIMATLGLLRCGDEVKADFTAKLAAPISLELSKVLKEVNIDSGTATIKVDFDQLRYKDGSDFPFGRISYELESTLDKGQKYNVDFKFNGTYIADVKIENSRGKVWSYDFNLAENSKIKEKANRLEQILDQLVKQIRRGKGIDSKTKVALFDFPAINKSNSYFGRYIAEYLTTALYKSDVNVLERNLIAQVLKEQEIRQVGLGDYREDGLTQLRAKGATAIVTGTITTISNEYSINARLISTEDLSILATANVHIPIYLVPNDLLQGVAR